ncbi:hypothetical protein ASPCAL12977 [Aspergillus calidoustus]|uniref:Uncharacterized protein n=1 Tax=Aspergillus calidoustus TaxID=454130 RepID=A0A0U5GGD7_ASPCI|nr:hypothetical protein ASPCAL12977 [Aspergillus calidoustus]
MSSLFQFQIDIIKGVTLSAQIVERLFKDCTEDDIQALVIPPLELFGQWLMVSNERIRQGETALVVRQPSWLRIPVTTSMPSIIRTIGKSMHLTSSFLFASCCTIGFSTQKSGELIHEMMDLKGYLAKYKVSPRLVCELVEILNGCRDFIPAPTPVDVYHMIAEKVWSERNMPQLKAGNYYNDCDAKGLAKLLVQVLDTLQDISYRQVYIEGGRTGILIASIFAWLRPEETAVFVNGGRIYPISQSQHESEPRLLICLRESQYPLDDEWKITGWKDVESIAETFLHIGGNDTYILKQHPSPWRGAKYQVEMKETSLVSNDIGHLAAALIDTITEVGTLRINDEREAVKLNEICSSQFLESYPEIMAQFGWRSLNTERVEKMVNAIKSRLHYLGSTFLQGPYVNILGRMIADGCKEYEQSHHEPMLLSLNSHTKDAEIIEHAINLAGQAIMSSLWLKLPNSLTFWPLEQGLLNELAEIITELLTQDLDSKCSFWKLRQRSILSIIPTTDVGLFDLACAGDGYVAYSSILSAQDENMTDMTDMTDRRLAGCIQVSPGCLKWQGMQGRYIRLVQETVDLRLAGRAVNNQEHRVELFNKQGIFSGIQEKPSQNRLDISIVNSIRSDYVKRTLYLRTHLEEELPPGSLLPKAAISTHWERSIAAVLRAKHIKTNMSRLEQLRRLVDDWNQRGRLGDALQWCLIGKIPRPGVRYITTTSSNTELRFFEAGNVSDGRKLIIRQGVVPLLHCVKIAMEDYGDESEWVIIA